MTSLHFFLLLWLMSGSILSLPTGASNRTAGEEDEILISYSDDSVDISDIIEAVNVNLGQEKGDPQIMFGDIAMATTSRNAVPCTAKGCMWPKSSGGVVYIPIYISPLYSTGERTVIIRSLVSFHRVTCIRFIWRNSGQKDYLYFYPSRGCWSYLGRQGGLQQISLQRRGCVYTGTVQHEVLHALGFHHEQVRSDRDNHVTINKENILTGKEHNFEKVETNNLATPYDYNSVMHYGRYAFSKRYGVLATIVPKPDPKAVIGGARQMSSNDINRVNRLYQCAGL